MPLSDFVQVNISSSGPAVTVPGFGTPLLVAGDAPAGFTNRVRTYNAPADLVSDGWATTDPTYLQATALCSQSPRPPSFKVGRGSATTQHFTITPTATNSATYGMTVGGTHVSFVADSSATAAEIVTGLAAAINALSISGLTVGGTTTLTLGMTASKFLQVSVDDTTLLKMVEDSSDPGVAADMAAIALEDNDWYCLLGQFNSSAVVQARATWAEANTKLYVAQSCDSDIINTALSGATDVATVLKSASRFRTSVWYAGSTNDFADAAISGVKLTTTPGSEIWGLTIVSGPVALKLTGTQRTNLMAKNANFVEKNVAGLNITTPGKVASGEWIDVVRSKDWQVADAEASLFTLLHTAAQTNSKVPFTDNGIQSVRAVLLASLKRGVDAGALASYPAPTVSNPKASAQSTIDKQNRTLTTLTAQAYLAGAIVAVKPITITLTY